MALLQYSTLYTIILTAVVITIPVLCVIQVIPERVKVVYMNDKYMYNYSCSVKRYSRTTPHYVSVEAALKYEWNNNVTMNIVSYEFHHNEYRRTFVELHCKYCDLLNFDKHIGAQVAAIGFTCPLVADKRYFMNFTLPMYDIPSVFPFEHARFDVEFTVTATSESIVKVSFYAHLKRILNKH